MTTTNDRDIQRGCQKFQENYKYYSDSDKEAIIFLKLRKEGCPRKSALNFSSKTVCKSDSTRTVFGPPNYRLLKVKKLPNYSIQKGWFSGNLTYKMDKEHLLSYKDVVHDNLLDDNMIDIFNKTEEQTKQEFKKMLMITRQYFDEISANFKLDRGNSNSDFLQSIKQLIEETRSALKHKTYFEYRNVKFYYLALQLKQAIEKENNSTDEIKGIIEKFNIFNEPLMQPDLKNIDIKHEDLSNDDSFIQISPNSKSGKKKGWQSSRVKNGKDKILNQSLQDSSMNSTYKASPILGSMTGSGCETERIVDMTQLGILSKQSSLGGLDYMSSDSIQSQGYQQSGEDRTVSPESEPLSGSYLADTNTLTLKKQEVSIIHNAAMQLKVLQQMDNTNQDLFSGSIAKPERVQPINCSIQSKRVLEQQFNEAQYFYQQDESKKKEDDPKKSLKKEGSGQVENQGGKMRITLHATQSTDDKQKPQNFFKKKKKVIKIQNLLKFDPDIEQVYKSLTEQALKTNSLFDDNQKRFQQQSQQQQVQQMQQLKHQKSGEIFPQPPSPNTQKQSLFKKDFVETNKTSETKLKYQENKKFSLNIGSISQGINPSESQKKIESYSSSLYPNGIQPPSNLFDQNLNNLVQQKNQMLENFRRRNYRNANSSQFSHSEMSKSQKQFHPAQAAKLKTTSNNYFSNSHFRNLTYSTNHDTQSNALQRDRSVHNSILDQTTMMQQKLKQLTSSMIKSGEITKRKISCIETNAQTPQHHTYYVTPKTHSTHTSRQLSQTKSILQNLAVSRHNNKSHSNYYAHS